MTDSANDPALKPPRFREAFERLVTEIREIEDGNLVPINLDVPSVVATVLGVSAKIRGFREDFVKHLPSFAIERFDRLESYALALGHAQTEHKTATEPSASLVELAAKVSRIRSILLNDINTLVARDLLPESVLKDVTGGTGHKNFAFDVLALSNLYRRNWAKVSAHTTVTTAELDDAEREADALTTAVGEREQSPAVLAQVVRDRQAAFTLLLERYDEIRTAFAYLRRNEGDADTLIPSLYLGRAAPRRASNPDNDTPSDPVASPTPGAPAPANPAHSTDAENATAAKPAAPAAGPYA